MAAAKDKPRKQLWTPAGRISFPFIAMPDTGREYSDNKYKTDLLIRKEAFKEHGKALTDAVIEVGKAYFGDKFTLKGKWKTPFKDTDTDDKVVNEAMKNCILVRAKASKQPLIIGPRKNSDGKFPELSPEEVQALKGGDWCVLNVTVFPYDQSGGGIALGLNVVQFWKTDTGFGQGRSKVLDSAEELDSPLDTPTAPVDNDSIV